MSTHPPHEIVIRPLAAADLPLVLALNQAEVPRLGPLDGPALDMLLPRCELALVAEAPPPADGAVPGDAVVAGFVLAIGPGTDYASPNYRYFEARGTNHLYIDRIAVSPSHRRQGIATLLQQAVEDHAQHTGRSEVTCEVNVRPANEGSLAFHTRRGYIEVGQQDTGSLRVALLAKPVGADSAVAGQADPAVAGQAELPPSDAPAGGRIDYDRAERDGRHLDVHTLGPDPVIALQRWLTDALEAQLPEPTAMTLATVDADGLPDARVVLLRHLDVDGLRFYTNRHSAKGQQLAHLPFAAAVLHWQPLERQVRIRGRVEALPDAESDAYFAGRPRASQLSAWASAQSSVVDSRPALEAQQAVVEARFADVEVPRPPHWGGYLLRPQTVEFWQGRPARLHDRIRYHRGEHGWHTERLQP